MTRAFDTVAAPDLVYRVGRPPDVWAWPPWSAVLRDGTFGNRWDDPLGRYRVLYASHSRLGAFLETLKPFRPDPSLAATYEEIAENDPEDPVTTPPGTLAPRWRDKRVIGQGLTDGVHEPLVAVGGDNSLSLIEPLARSVGIASVDAETIRTSRQRAFTQGVSRLVFGRRQPVSRKAYAGIFYPSFFGGDVKNYALFERASQPRPVSHISRERIDETDGDFVEACRRRGLVPA
jgi:hypothetical protein